MIERERWRQLPIIELSMACSKRIGSVFKYHHLQ